MADIFDTAIGLAEPVLKAVGGLVADIQSTVQGIVNEAVKQALKANAPAAAPEPPARVRPLRAPGR